MYPNAIADTTHENIDAGGSSAAIVRMTGATLLLLALGVGAAGTGAWLLCTAPASGTAQALARVEAEKIAYASRVASHIVSQPVMSVEVRASIPGRVASVRFGPGAYVRKGETLLLLDPEPFADAVEHSSEAVALARGRLGIATAALGRAQRAYDDGEIDEVELHARVRAQRDAHGGLRAAAEALELAQHELTLTRIAAPIGGRVDEVRVSVGDRVGAAPDGGVLVTIVVPETVYAEATPSAEGGGRHAGDPRPDESGARRTVSLA